MKREASPLASRPSYSLKRTWICFWNPSARRILGTSAGYQGADQSLSRREREYSSRFGGKLSRRCSRAVGGRQPASTPVTVPRRPVPAAGPVRHAGPRSAWPPTGPAPRGRSGSSFGRRLRRILRRRMRNGRFSRGFLGGFDSLPLHSSLTHSVNRNLVRWLETIVASAR